MLEDIRLVHLIMSKFALVKTTFFFIHLKKMIFFFFGGIIKKKGKEKNPSWLGSSNTADCQFCLMMEHK